MIKLYMKQAWTMMQQNKLFTSIYVAGTGLSIALVMTLFIIFYVKFAPIYPEYNRNRILSISTSMRVGKHNEGKWSCNSGVSYYFVSDYLQKLKHAEAVAAVETNNGTHYLNTILYKITFFHGGSYDTEADTP